MSEMIRTATIIDCYRYDLHRTWAPGPTMLWVGLNPSTADAYEDDPTIRRVMNFAKREGCGTLAVGNLYAYRATDPKDLWVVEDPVGPDNAWYLVDMAKKAHLIVLGWGVNAKDDRVDEAMLCFSGLDVYCLGTTKYGHPKHPLYLRKDTELKPFIRCGLERL